MLRKLTIAIKGLIVGGTMIIPGMSGGSMAMVLGIYDDLVSSVSSFFRHKRKSLIFLALFCLGALAGFVLLANPLEFLLDKYPMLLMYFFMGAVAGSIPMMLKKAQIEKAHPKVLLYTALGIAVALSLSLLPTNLLNVGERNLGYYLLLFFAGIVAAIALILPGISFSHMMLMLGLYNPLLQTIQSRDPVQLFSLSPLLLGVFAGIVCTTKLLETAMRRFPTGTYLIILGFLLGSVIDVFPGLPTGWEIPLCILLFAIGFTIIFFLARMEEAKEAAAGDAPRELV